MKKLLPGLTVCLMVALAAQAAQDEWINRQEVNNPQVDARIVRNYGILNISPTGLPFTFDNNLEFYNDAGGILKISSPGISFEYHDSSAAYGKTNTVPMDIYFNEGTLSGGPIRIHAKEVIDSGVTMASGYGGIDVTGDSLDLWGVHYQAMSGNSAYLDPDGHHTSAFSRPPSIYSYAWGHGVNNYLEGGPTQSIYGMADGAQAQANLPTGGTDMVGIRVARAANWWDDTNYKAYIRSTMYDMNTNDPKPFYQVVFVPNDTISYEYADPQDPTSPITGCKSYNQFRVAFGGAPYDMPFQPYTQHPDYGAAAVIVYQYSYTAEDAQGGPAYPRYNQIIMEDLTGYFYQEMAENGYVQDYDARGCIPDRFRVDCRNSAVSYEYFVYAPWRGMPIGQLALPPCYKVDPNTGEPILDENKERIPAWTQEDAPSQSGPYLLSVAASCLSGSDREDNPDLKWLQRGHEYRLFDPESPDPGKALVDVDYSVYSANVGADNAFNKKALASQGIFPQPFIDTTVAPGHITISGNDAVLDNMFAEAQESITLNITNLISAENVSLNANYVSAFFSKLKEGAPEGTTLKLEEVVSPQMTRFMGDIAMYSGIYKVSFEICEDPYDREEAKNGGDEAEAADEGDEGGDEGGDGGEGEGEEEPEEPEWEDKEFYFHVVYISSSSAHRAVYPNVDNFVVQTELPVEVNDTIAVGEEFKFDTPALTLDGTMSFPKTVVDTNFVNMVNFTNLANLVMQGQMRNSGVFTNTYNESPSISFYLGQNRSPRLENLINEGSFSFSEVNLDADYMAFINGGSAAAANSVTLTADKMLLNEAQLNGAIRTEVNTKELDIFATDLTGGDPNYQTSGTIELNVTDRIYDGFNGVTNIVEGSPVVQHVPQNEVTAMGSISIPNKPAAGDLMNTRITITNPRVSRNTWSGDDRGDTLDGWTDNMALGALVLKGSISGNQALRYDFTSPKANGALYVRDLYLGVETSATEDLTLDYGKMLTFKNMKLYYVNCYQLELLPPPPGGSSTSTNAVWVLKDKFPGKNANVVQTQNHPDWATPIEVLTTSSMAFSIRFASSVELSADELTVTPLELRWMAYAGSTYKVEVADSLEGGWKTFYVTEPTESGEVVIPLDPEDSMKFFRLIRE
ncbi:MAG: hypothetical protein IK033_01920 [Verrucomicrobia bacterium]|nr:hypothetical protein [Verrucomicrobiota bacterium]